MKRGTTPACRYCSTDDVLRSVRLPIRRFGLLTPDLAFHELDGVARGIADVNGPSARRPRDLAFDLDALVTQAGCVWIEFAALDSEREMPLAARAVRWDEAPRPAAHRRP